jgi:hypothetical protein
VTRYAKDHPATKAMGEGEEKPAIFETVRIVNPLGDRAVPVIFSSATTIEKRDISEIHDVRKYNELIRENGSLFNPEKDRKGPFPLAAACEVPGATDDLVSRAVVTGTQSFTSNQGLMFTPYQKDLFLNLVNWLTRRESHMGIAPKSEAGVDYHVRPRVRKRVFLLVLVFMPLIALVTGVGVWFSRRT